MTPARRFKRHELGFGDYPFFRSLSTELCQEIFQASRVRQYGRGARIRGMTVRGGDAVHIVLNDTGIVSEELVHHEASTLRFRHQGHVLGDLDLFAPSRAPLAMALTTTVTMAVPMNVMRSMIGKHPTLMRAVSVSITERLRTTERVYGMFARPAEQRLCGLFVELLDRTGFATEDGYRVQGPSQLDLAQALMLSRATVENALRSLRAKQVVKTSYRSYTFPDLKLLEKVEAGVAAPVGAAECA
ncbi:Crp/Fnr family transcriptional regulator [Streptomyces sp. NPDC048507]|uniref:Crp/Fnr family transcriptional regulator n=1 Tax=Streptomyces sp. NPDC048507 TaxID=3365560 RepID=UPI00371A311A